MEKKPRSFEELTQDLAAQDAEATSAEIVHAHELTDQYMQLLKNPNFLKGVESGEFLVKEQYGKNAEGDKVLEYVEIRNKAGEILLMENTAAIIAMSEYNSARAEQSSTDKQ